MTEFANLTIPFVRLVHFYLHLHHDLSHVYFPSVIWSFPSSTTHSRKQLHLIRGNPRRRVGIIMFKKIVVAVAFAAAALAQSQFSVNTPVSRILGPLLSEHATSFWSNSQTSADVSAAIGHSVP